MSTGQRFDATASLIDPFGEAICDVHAVETGDPTNILSSGRLLDHAERIWPTAKVIAQAHEHPSLTGQIGHSPALSRLGDSFEPQAEMDLVAGAAEMTLSGCLQAAAGSFGPYRR